jgi:hypothetical protein
MSSLCIRGFAFAAVASVMLVASPAIQAAPAERFEVTSIKAVRPTLVSTINALQAHDAKKAKAAFDDYDTAWNGIEVYINTRSKEMYDSIEHHYQADIEKALAAPNPDTDAVLTEARAMLTEFDKAIDMVSKAKPLNSKYDDVAQLRIVRSPLRKVAPALKTGDLAKARDSFNKFNDKWDSIEDLVKERSADGYTTIESTMIKLERALMADKPNQAEVEQLVTGIMRPYNEALAQVVKDARG